MSNSMHHSGRHIFYHPWILVFYFFDVFLQAILNLAVLILGSVAVTLFWFVVVVVDVLVFNGAGWLMGTAIVGWLISMGIISIGWMLWLFRLLLPTHYE